MGILVVVIVVLAAGGAYYFMQQKPTGPPPAEGPINIGVISDLTKCAPIIGEEALNGATMAVEEINSQGGVLGRQFQLFSADEGCDPTVAVTAATNMIRQNKVIAIVGWTFTGQALAAQPVLMRSKVIGIGDVSGGAALTENVLKNYTNFKYWFQGNFNTTGWALQTVTFLRDVVHAKSAYYVVEDFVWTHIVWEKLQQLAPDITWYGPDYVSADATDYSAELVKIAAAKPDAIVNLMTGTNGAIFARQRATNPDVVKIPIFGNGITALEVPSVIESLEAAQPGSTQYISVGVDAWVNPANPRSVTYFNNYMSKYKAVPDFSVDAFAYDAVYFLAEAIKKTGSTDPDALVATMEQLGYQGITGGWAFDKSHSLKLGPGYVEGPIIQWVDARPQVIWPASMANATWVDPRKT